MNIGGDPAKCNRTQPKSLMSGDWVGNVGFFECLDLLRGQFEAEGGKGVFKMLRFGGPNNRSGHHRFVEQPSQGDLGRRDAPSLGEFLQARYDLLVRFSGLAV
jgi:hypothetical protein